MYLSVSEVTSRNTLKSSYSSIVVIACKPPIPILEKEEEDEEADEEELTGGYELLPLNFTAASVKFEALSLEYIPCELEKDMEDSDRLEVKGELRALMTDWAITPQSFSISRFNFSVCPKRDKRRGKGEGV